MSDFAFTLDVHELEEYVLRLEAAANDITLAGRGVLEKYSTLIVQEARRLVPVRTGHLRDSIQVGPTNASRAGHVAAATIQVGAHYAGFVEFGTVFMAPRPYMRPAIAKHRKAYQREILKVGTQLLGSRAAGIAATRGRTERFTRAGALQAAA